MRGSVQDKRIGDRSEGHPQVQPSVESQRPEKRSLRRYGIMMFYEASSPDCSRQERDGLSMTVVEIQP